MATTSYPLDAADWKGRFIYELTASMDASERIRVMLWGPYGELPGGVVSANSPEDTGCLKRMADNGGMAHLIRKRPFTGLLYATEILSRLRKACLRNRVDLYHVNWLQLALGLPQDGRPLYVGVLGSDFGMLRLPGMTHLLRRVFAGRRTLLAPNAAWMAARLHRLFGDVAEVRPNPFGVSPQWFDVVREPAAPSEWLVVSRITRNKLGDLLAWGEGLFDGSRRLRLLGPMQEQIELPDWIEHGGPTNPEALVKRWFPRAAGLLTLSRHDEGRPQVIIEAMAAGLPVIASRIPAHVDLIQHGETGWLVSTPQQFAEALIEAEQPAITTDVGRKARTLIREQIGTWDHSASRCLAAYRELLEMESPRVE